MQLIYAALMGKQISDALRASDCAQIICPTGGPVALYDNQLRAPIIAIACMIGGATAACAALSYRLTSEYNWTQFKCAMQSWDVSDQSESSEPMFASSKRALGATGRPDGAATASCSSWRRCSGPSFVSL